MKQLSLHQHHIDLGAKTGPFAGFEMPLTYQGVKAEHLCDADVRTIASYPQK